VHIIVDLGDMGSENLSHLYYGPPTFIISKNGHIVPLVNTIFNTTPI